MRTPRDWLIYADFARRLIGIARQLHVNELFFRWIKQHLDIKSFFGTCENAVKSQIWIAVSVYVLAAIVRKRLNLSRNLYEILQILGLNLFEKTSLFVALTTDPSPPEWAAGGNHPILCE